MRRLSEQFRRFLDDQVWVENRRVLDLVREIETAGLELRLAPPSLGLEIDEAQVSISLPFERPLYDVKPASEVDSSVSVGVEELDTTALFEQTVVDHVRLAAQLRTVVPPRSSALLADILELYPLRDGVAELVGYLALTDDDLSVELDETQRVEVSIDDERGRRTVSMPQATVSRS